MNGCNAQSLVRLLLYSVTVMVTYGISDIVSKLSCIFVQKIYCEVCLLYSLPISFGSCFFIVASQWLSCFIGKIHIRLRVFWYKINKITIYHVFNINLFLSLKCALIEQRFLSYNTLQSSCQQFFSSFSTHYKMQLRVFINWFTRAFEIQYWTSKTKASTSWFDARLSSCWCSVFIEHNWFWLPDGGRECVKPTAFIGQRIWFNWAVKKILW